ncbi:DUF2490 domain-containing protein [Sphingobacterium rhinopitheci]|nr:DUF2490 domain-containing protein [Sphingobacterium rhinopitheci]
MNAKLDKKNLTFFTQYRSFDYAPDPRLFLVATALNFELKNNITPGFGLMYLNLQSYIGDTDNKRIRNEIRPYQQISINNKINNLSISNRLIIEERILNNPDIFIVRLRYRLALRVPLNKSNKFYANLSNELMVNAYNADFYDRDRVTAVLGYRIKKSTVIELGYINELRKNNNSAQYAFVGVRQSVDWRKIK